MNEDEKNKIIAHELMLLDWVEIYKTEREVVPLSENEFTSELTETRNPIQVKQIARDTVGYEAWVEFFQKNIFLTEECENIRPIGLSEEILELNGILPKSGYSDGETTIEYVFYEGFNFGIETKDGSYRFVAWNVHELQNALRMCGLTEMADNFIITANSNN